MKMAKATSADAHKLTSSYHLVRKTLLTDKYRDRMGKPLAYWALPNDRRLPLAFLGRTLGDLLETPFQELCSTPGIGEKKIGALVLLLKRAAKNDPPSVPFGLPDLVGEDSPSKNSKRSRRNGSQEFDPDFVSEALWTQWRETIRRHDIGHKKLGRLAPTLQTLPTVIWHTPLNYYLNYTLVEIRQLKTHGEKRVRVVLEVFFVANTILADAGTQEHLQVSLVPQFTIPLRAWIEEVIKCESPPSNEAITNQLAIPMLDQIEHDAGDLVHNLAEGCIGLQSSPQSVRTQSRRVGVTRARVYQLLNTCHKVMSVRWPEGRYLLKELAQRVEEQGADEAAVSLLAEIREFFYPGKDSIATRDGD